MRWYERLFFGLSFFAVASFAHAWSNHAIGTWQALNALPEVRAEPLVKVEPLVNFLKDQGPALEGLLQQEEQWARGHVRNYPARPENLAYRHDRDLDPNARVRRFLHAVRVNPNMPLPLYVQLQPTLPASVDHSRVELTWQDISSHKVNVLGDTQFVALKESELISVMDVIATASDEPDYGMDTGLWDNNATEFGKIYGFGKQPLGDPRNLLASQVSFHSGFFHESTVLYASSGALRRSFPEYRMHLWQTLARHALLTGHPYWGWRFAGWAMHYAQDLTQPYHASVLPGRSVASMLLGDGLALSGMHEYKDEAFRRVSLRHLALENFHQLNLKTALQKGNANDPNLLAFANLSKDQGRLVLTEFSLRDDVSKSAYNAAAELDGLVVKALPLSHHEWVQTSYVFNSQNNNSPIDGPAREALEKNLADLSGNFGRVTRAIWRRLR